MAVTPVPGVPQRLYPFGTALPTVYDPSWQSYTNLTPDQIAAFKAFPQDLINYAGNVRVYYEQRTFPQTMTSPPTSVLNVGGVPVTLTVENMTKITALAVDAQLNPASIYNFTVNGTVFSLNATQALALFGGVRGYIQQCRDIEANMINGINGQTITQQSQIDAAFTALN